MVPQVQSEGYGHASCGPEAVCHTGKRSGKAATIAIAGPPSSGKTFLATQLSMEFQERGLRVSVIAADDGQEDLKLRSITSKILAGIRAGKYDQSLCCASPEVLASYRPAPVISLREQFRGGLEDLDIPALAKKVHSDNCGDADIVIEDLGDCSMRMGRELLSRADRLIVPVVLNHQLLGKFNVNGLSMAHRWVTKLRDTLRRDGTELCAYNYVENKVSAISEFGLDDLIVQYLGGESAFHVRKQRWEEAVSLLPEQVGKFLAARVPLYWAPYGGQVLALPPSIVGRTLPYHAGLSDLATELFADIFASNEKACPPGDKFASSFRATNDGDFPNVH